MNRVLLICLIHWLSALNPGCRVEVFSDCNAPADAGPEISLNNKICVSNIESWKRENKQLLPALLF